MGSMAGGGSGHVEWTQRKVMETMTVQATVGNGTAYNWWAPCCGCGARAGASAVIWWEGSEVFLIAQPGGDGTGGGGGRPGDCAGNGGMAGGDGTCVGGGKGSGVRLEDIPIKGFNLTAGKGGCNGSGGRAGGGGGVLIDGEAPWDGVSHGGHPEDPNNPPFADCRDKWARNGEGFGGGAYGYGNTGMPGAVLFAIESVVAERFVEAPEIPEHNMICSNLFW